MAMYDITGVSYCPTHQPEWFTKAMFSGKIVDGGYVKIIPNIKNSTLFDLLDFDGNVLQKSDMNCGWNPQGTVRISEQELKISTYKIQLEDCIEKFETTWMADKMKAGANNLSIPADLESASLDLIANAVNKELERLMFEGDSANANEFDGYVKILTDSTKTNKIVGSTLTKANVVGEFEKIYQAIPEGVLAKGESEVKFYTSFNTFRNIRMALADISNQVIAAAFSMTGDKIYYLGLEIVPTIGLKNDQVICTYVDNLAFGTDLVSDFAQISLESGKTLKDKDMIYVSGRLKLGVGVPYPEDAVLYSA